MKNAASQRTGAARWILLGVPVMILGGCSLEVTNPGPVEDSFLAQPSAYAGIVNGAGRDLSDAINWIAYTGSAIAREVHPAGSTGSFGITPLQQQGTLADHEVNDHWNRAHRARWTAEDGTKRMKAAMGADFGKSQQGAQILLWSAYANRLLGENFCNAVIDGSASQPHVEHFKRAEAQFTEAISTATAANQANLVTAARAGRASARMSQGNWAGAVEDAAAVPTAFRYVMPYYASELDLYNRVHEASRNQPYRAHTTWNTVYEKYYEQTRDPRTPWSKHATVLVGDAAVLTLGRVPWYFQTKYADRNSAIPLATGREMRLIEAEARLRSGDWQAAMTAINALRTSINVPVVTAANATEAWARLKRERGIELWLEARRLGDLRRWKEGNVPGDLDPLEMVGTASNLRDQSLCFPISLSEKETNPNLR